MIRCGTMNEETKRLKNRFLKSKVLSLRTKIILINSYILSKGTYNCGTWPPLLKPCISKFHSTVMAMYRIAAGNYYIKDEDNSHLLSDADVIFHYQFISPINLIKMSNLSLFCRILIKNSEYILSIIRQMSEVPSGWIKSVRDNVIYCSSHPDCYVFSGKSFEDILNIVAQDPRYWLKIFRKILRLPYYNLIITDKGQEGPPSLSLLEDPEEPPPHLYV